MQQWEYHEVTAAPQDTLRACQEAGASGWELVDRLPCMIQRAARGVIVDVEPVQGFHMLFKRPALNRLTPGNRVIGAFNGQNAG